MSGLMLLAANAHILWRRSQRDLWRLINKVLSDSSFTKLSPSHKCDTIFSKSVIQVIQYAVVYPDTSFADLLQLFKVEISATTPFGHVLRMCDVDLDDVKAINVFLHDSDMQHLWNSIKQRRNVYISMATEHIISICEYMAYKVLWIWRKTSRFQHVHFSFVTRLARALASWRWRRCHFRHRRVVCYKNCQAAAKGNLWSVWSIWGLISYCLQSLLLTGRGSPSPKICLLRT